MNELLSRVTETSESTIRSQRGQIRRADYRKRSLTAMEEAAHALLGSANLGFVEELFEQYQRDPASVSEDWRRYFATLGNGAGTIQIGPSFKPAGVFNSGNHRNGSAAPQPARLSAPRSGVGRSATVAHGS